MLSHRLASLSSHFEHWGLRPGGVDLTASLCNTLARELAEMADHARAMEGQPVPPRFRPEIGGNVIAFPGRAA